MSLPTAVILEQSVVHFHPSHFGLGDECLNALNDLFLIVHGQHLDALGDIEFIKNETMFDQKFHSLLNHSSVGSLFAHVVDINV